MEEGNREEQQVPEPPVPQQQNDEAQGAPEQATDPSSTPARASSKAESVLKDTTALLARLGVQARDAAIVAGKKLDQAALTVGAAVDNYAIQVRVFRFSSQRSQARNRTSLHQLQSMLSPVVGAFAHANRCSYHPTGKVHVASRRKLCVDLRCP